MLFSKVDPHDLNFIQSLKWKSCLINEQENHEPKFCRPGHRLKQIF